MSSDLFVPVRAPLPLGTVASGARDALAHLADIGEPPRVVIYEYHAQCSLPVSPDDVIEIGKLYLVGTDETEWGLELMLHDLSEIRRHFGMAGGLEATMVVRGANQPGFLLAAAVAVTVAEAEGSVILDYAQRWFKAGGDLFELPPAEFLRWLRVPGSFRDLYAAAEAFYARLPASLPPPGP
jgi:hypothetical protein